MAKRSMRVLTGPLPDDAKIVTALDSTLGPVLSGGGWTTLLCGSCGFVVARRIDPAAVQGLVLRCPRCCKDNSAV
jgi:hypothetical protein